MGGAAHTAPDRCTSMAWAPTTDWSAIGRNVATIPWAPSTGRTVFSSSASDVYLYSYS